VLGAEGFFFHFSPRVSILKKTQCWLQQAICFTILFFILSHDAHRVSLQQNMAQAGRLHYIGPGGSGREVGVCLGS
jgi:hypothetical protein